MEKTIYQLKLLKLMNLLQNGPQSRFSMNSLINWMKRKKTKSVEICLRYLRNEEDWIVINQSLNFIRNHLERFDFKDSEMMKLLKNFVNDERKSISKNAEKLIKILP